MATLAFAPCRANIHPTAPSRRPWESITLSDAAVAPDVTVKPLDLGQRSRRPRVDTLVRLRWLAVSGQLSAVLATFVVLGFPMPFARCLFVVSLSIWVNIGLRVRFGHSDRLEDRPAAYLMAYDLLQLTLLLYLTGGLENPFSMLFLAPLLIAAVSLSARYTTALTLLVIVCASTLAVYHRPLPWFPGEALHLPFFYIAGVWGAIVLGASFAAAYAWRIAEEARRLADALAATELVLVREQHLTQLDGLAAAAAHELGHAVGHHQARRQGPAEAVPGRWRRRRGPELVDAGGGTLPKDSRHPHVAR